MRLWMVIVLVGLLKMPLAALLLWMPFHDDGSGTEAGGSSQDDGGSKTLPGWRHPRDPLPRLPRRGPHGAAGPGPPRRVRPAAPRARAGSCRR